MSIENDDLVNRLRTHDDERLYREADILMQGAADEIAKYRRILDGLPQYAIDGGWTAKGICSYAMEFPRQKNKEGGWTIDTKFLSKIHDGFCYSNEEFNPSMEGTECVLLALERMINFSCHSSDCAMHNMPAMPNNACDCGFDILQIYIDSDRQKTREINILTQENRKLSQQAHPIDERAEFEKWWRNSKHFSEHYQPSHLLLEGWQARAALAKGE